MRCSRRLRVLIHTNAGSAQKVSDTFVFVSVFSQYAYAVARKTDADKQCDDDTEHDPEYDFPIKNFVVS